MVQLARREPVAVYEVLDGEGCPIGRVVQPAGQPVVARMAATVFLSRAS